MDEVGIETARATLGEIVDRARMLGQVTQINRNGKPAAVIVPVEQWGDMQAELASKESKP